MNANDVISIRYMGKDMPVHEVQQIYDAQIHEVEKQAYADDATRDRELKRVRKKFRKLGLDV